MIEIEIGGEKRKFSFGLEVLGWVQKDSGLDLTETEGMTDTSLYFILIKPLIYRGNERELKKEGKRPDFTPEDVEKWLEDKGMYDEDILKIWNAFNETLVSLTPKIDVKGEEEKKR